MDRPVKHGLRLVQAMPGVNHVISYGQSLSSGWEGWPALSVQPRLDQLMLGHSVRGQSEAGPHWQPVGDADFHPLLATVQDQVSGALLNAEQVAGLPAGATALGETVLEGALREYARDWPPSAGQEAWLLASACGVGGRTLEALSSRAPVELFNRLRDCTRLARDASGRSGRAYRLLAFLVLQGEQNAWGLDGGTAERAEYRAKLMQLYHDMVRELAQGIVGQDGTPAMFLYQTGGAYTSDELGVAMAQLDVALGLPGCFLVAPSYPVTSKGGHLDANGYRWLGAQFGKVMHRVLTLGEAWRPLYPTQALHGGDEVEVRFAVPVPPLAWGQPFRGHRRVEVADRGFSVFDSEGAVGIRSVALVGADRVQLRLGRPVRGTASVRYADQRHGGVGSLHDSDPAQATTCYEFAPHTGHSADANVAELVGRPYPLQNWCVAFNVPLQAR